MKKIAFTLAEVLLTLTIVGVVSAMTLSSLMNALEDRDMRARSKKAYNTIQNAITMKQALTDLSPADVKNNQLLRYFLSAHYDSSGNLSGNTTGVVLRNVWSSTSGGGVISFSDGQVWTVPTVDKAVENMDAACDNDPNTKRYERTCTDCSPCYIQVDLNGAGGPNICAPNQKWYDANDVKMDFCYFDGTGSFSHTEFNRAYRDIVFFEIRGMNVKPYTKHGVTRRYFGNKK